MKKTQLLHSLLLLLTAVIWGVAFVAQSAGMDHVGPYTFNCARSLLGGLVPQSYAGHWVVLLLGCGFLGFGVALEVVPNVLILPCEGFVRVCSQQFHWDFGKTKTGFDLTMVAAATLLSLLDLGAIYGLREGTVVCALTVGYISRFFCKRLAFLVKRPAPAELIRADVPAA